MHLLIFPYLLGILSLTLGAPIPDPVRVSKSFFLETILISQGKTSVSPRQVNLFNIILNFHASNVDLCVNVQTLGTQTSDP